MSHVCSFIYSVNCHLIKFIFGRTHFTHQILEKGSADDTLKWHFINTENKTAPENLYSTQIIMSISKSRRPVKFIKICKSFCLIWETSAWLCSLMLSEIASLYLQQSNKHLKIIPTRWKEMLNVSIVFTMELHLNILFWINTWNGNPEIRF